MARNAKDVPAGNGGNMVADLLDQAPYAARVVQVIFMGVQKQRPYKGTEKPPVDEVRLTYELSEEFMKDEDGNLLEDKPRWFSESIPFHSLNADRAKSTARYKAIDPKDESDGDFDKLLGRACQVVIVHNPGRGKHEGKTFQNIGDVTPAINLRGYKQPGLVNTPVFFDPQDEENCDLETFNSFPEFLQEQIKNAEDFDGSPLHKKLGGQAQEEGNDGQNEDNFDDKEWA